MNSVARANGMSVLQRSAVAQDHDTDLALAGSFALARPLTEPHDGRPLFARRPQGASRIGRRVCMICRVA
jgi:hypothetical protein